ncbi:MAG: type II secretion system protein GspM [Candidatus Binatia bacterium]|nr:type II secretion system protein GspM [Candidatus Binatia bacterium]
MRDFIADLLARLQATNRQQRLYMAVGILAAVVLLRYGTTWFFDYRAGVKADIKLSAQRLAGAEKLLERAPQIQQQLKGLRKRYRSTVSQLVPGATPTLAAAELQDRVSNLAAKNNVRIQTTQVLKDEAVGPFRQVSLRVTASGDIRDLAGLLSELELGNLRVTIPFLELSRRGAAIRRRTKSPQARAVSATFQIAGVVAGSAGLAEEGAPETAQTAQTAAGAGEAAPPAPVAKAAARSVPVAVPVADREEIPQDPLGTAQTVNAQ